jgi:biotin carboxylase
MIKLAIIGASYLQLPLVIKANEMNIETHCFAWPDGAVCADYADYFYPISILEKEEIFNKCKAIGIDGITSIATDMAVPTISFVAEKLNLIANSYYSALISTNKLLMRKAFQNYGCMAPNFIEFKEGNLSLSQMFYPLIVKPVDRSGSRGVTRVESESELMNSINVAKAESFSSSVIIEEFIEGLEVSVESISWNGRHKILAITDKITTGAPHFVELGHHQPSNLPYYIQEKIKKQTVECLNALNIFFGASHSEFKINTHGEVFVIEVGARMGGDFIGSNLVELSTGFDFLTSTINIAIGKYEEPNLFFNKFSGVYYLSKETEKIYPYFQKENYFDYKKEIFNTDLKLINNSNDRSGYLIYQANNRIELLG